MLDDKTLRCIGGPLHGVQYATNLRGSLRFPVERDHGDEPGETTYLRRTARFKDGHQLVFQMEYLAWDGISGETADRLALRFICREAGVCADA